MESIISFLIQEGTVWALCVAILLSALVVLWKAREDDRDTFDDKETKLVAKIDDLVQKRFDSELKLQMLTDASIRRDEAMLAALQKRGSRS